MQSYLLWDVTIWGRTFDFRGGINYILELVKLNFESWFLLPNLHICEWAEGSKDNDDDDDDDDDDNGDDDDDDDDGTDR